MPFKVTGADGRVIEDNLPDAEAEALARRVSAATGEPVTLTPFTPSDEGYVLDVGAAKEVQHVEPVEDSDESAAELVLAEMTVGELKAFAVEHELDVDLKLKKDELLAAIEQAVVDKQNEDNSPPSEDPPSTDD